MQWLLISIFLNVAGGVSFAQEGAEDDLSSLDQIESELTQSRPVDRRREQNREQDEEIPEPQSLADLSRLSSFEDISVIQKRFMPKTQRFQLSLGLGGIANDPWFNGLGASARFGYFLREAWGLELSGTFLSSSQKDSAKDLFENNRIKTDSIVTTKGFTGVSLIWNPIYGKMSLFNQRIVPFDMFFSVGLAQSAVDGATQKSIQSFQFGTGQIYAMTKSFGFRWDLLLNNYSATQFVNPGETAGPATNFNNLVLMVGVSYLFPDVGYR